MVKNIYKFNGLMQVRTNTIDLDFYNSLLREVKNPAEFLFQYAIQPLPKLALIHASESLGEQLFSKEPTGHQLTKLSNGIFKYFNRHANRTVPFGLFVAHRAFINDYNLTDNITNTPLKIAVSKVGIGAPSKYLALQRKYVPYNQPIKIGLNPTIVQFEQSYNWISSNFRLDGNTKNMRIKRSEAISTIFNLLTEINNCDTASLIDFINSRFTNLKAAEIHNFIGKLLEIEFLQSENILQDRLDESIEWFDVDLFGPTRSDLSKMYERLDSSRAEQTSSLGNWGAFTNCGTEFIDTHLSSVSEVHLNREEVKTLEEVANLITLTSARLPESYSYLEQWRALFVEKYGFNNPVNLVEAINPYIGLGPIYGYNNPCPIYIQNIQKITPWDFADLELRLKMLKNLEKRNNVEGVDLSDKIFSSELSALEDRFTSQNTYPDLDFSVQLGMNGTKKTFLLRSDSVALGGHSFTRSRRTMTAGSKERWTSILNNLAADQGVECATLLLSQPLSANLDYLVPNGNELQQTISTELFPQGHSLSDLFIIATESELQLATREDNDKFTTCIVNMPTLVIPLAFKNEARAAIDISRHGYLIPASFSWAQLEGSSYLPEVRFADVVLRPAEWKISKSLKQDAKACIKLNTYEPLRRTLASMGIVGDFFFASGDNRLHFTTHSDFSLEQFAKITQRSTGAERLEKSSLDCNRGLTFKVKDSEHKTYSTEIIFSTSRKINTNRKDVSIKRIYNHQILEEQPDWITIIFLTTPDVINNLAIIAGNYTAGLCDQSLVKNWFYVRYNDDGCSLRLRWQLEEETDRLWRHIKELASTAESQALLRNWQVTKYAAETARYGTGPLLEICHEAFSISANFALADLNRMANKFTVLDYSDAVINAFKYLRSIGVPLTFIQEIMPKTVKPTENCRKHWRKHSSEILLLLKRIEASEIGSSYCIYDRILAELKEKEKIVQIVLDLLHMHLNRLHSSGDYFENDCYWVMRQALHRKEFCID